MARNVLRVLKIKDGETTDSEGRSIGSDWLCADLGLCHDGYKYYVTTDRVRASEAGYFEELDPDKMAQIIVDHINELISKKLR